MRKEEVLSLVDKLPPLPESIQKLEELFRETQYPDTSKLVSVIGGDPALTADILAFANSPLYGFSKEIHSIQQAIVLLGSQNVRKMALKSALSSSFAIDLSPYGISVNQFIKIASMQSELVFQWYMGVDMEKAKYQIPLAFLMEAGAIVIAQAVLKEGNTKAFQNDILSMDLEDVEKKYTGLTTLQVGYTLFEHWELNEIFSEVLHVLDDESYKADSFIEELAFMLSIVRYTINLKNQFLDENIGDILHFLDENNYDSKKFSNACERIKKKFASI